LKKRGLCDIKEGPLVLQLHLFFSRGGSMNWMSEAGAEAFHTLYGSHDSHLRAHEMREAEQSKELCSKAARLCASRDLEFVGGMINRALTEGFSKIAAAILEQHKGRLDPSGNSLLMLATMQKLTLVVKEMVYMGGVNIEQRNQEGDTAMNIACREVHLSSVLSLCLTSTTLLVHPCARRRVMCQ
jgi:hypothetical protein